MFRIDGNQEMIIPGDVTEEWRVGGGGRWVAWVKSKVVTIIRA